MDERTLTALRGSIEKWEKIVEGTGEDKGYRNCPLCRAFLDQYETDDEGNEEECAGCPVKAKTGYAGCDNTPYIQWSESHGKWHGQEAIKVETAEHKSNALAELNFLKSLLPTTEVPPT